MENSKDDVPKVERKGLATSAARRDTGRISALTGTVTLALDTQEARERGKVMAKEVRREKAQDPVVTVDRKVVRLLSGTSA